MEKEVVLVCAAVEFLCLLSAALGFAAEATRINASDVKATPPGECMYPKTPALALGLTAAIALMMAHKKLSVLLLGAFVARGINMPLDTNWTVALASFIISWVTFVIAFLLLLSGAALNDQRGEENMYFGSYCYVIKPWVFAGGALLSLANILFGILYYISLSRFKSTQPWGSQANQGIAMVQPEISP